MMHESMILLKFVVQGAGFIGFRASGLRVQGSYICLGFIMRL